jgi:hypothetical protein
VGLDSVELVMAIQEEFGIEIQNEDAEQIVTVGQMYDFLRKTLHSRPPAHCMTQRMFYRVRRAIIENYGVPKQAITLPMDFSMLGRTFIVRPSTRRWPNGHESIHGHKSNLASAFTLTGRDWPIKSVRIERSYRSIRTGGTIQQPTILVSIFMSYEQFLSVNLFNFTF